VVESRYFVSLVLPERQELFDFIVKELSLREAFVLIGCVQAQLCSINGCPAGFAAVKNR